MTLIIRGIRRSLTQLLYRLAGLKIAYWRKEVERLWSLNPEEYERQLTLCLSKNRPIEANGSVIATLDDLENASPLTKETLRKRGRRPDQSGKLFSRHTAGTTGQPTYIWLNKDELGRMLGVRDYCFRRYGVKLGDREARLWGRPETGWKAALKNYLMNRKVFHPVGADRDKQMAALLDYKPTYVYGYSSLILEAARAIKEGELKIPSIRCVICTAETILPTQKRFIAEQFRAPVAEEYGSTEFDSIAFECKAGHRHLVNPWLIMETSGDDIMISDVSRQTQHLIRYQAGDVLECERSSCNQLGSNVIISTLEGRSIDRFAIVSPDEKFHAVEFSRALDLYYRESGASLDFQVAQTGVNKFILRIVNSERIDKNSVCEFVKRHVLKTTGYHINLDVIQSADVSGFSGSKRSYFITESAT